MREGYKEREVIAVGLWIQPFLYSIPSVSCVLLPPFLCALPTKGRARRKEKAGMKPTVNRPSSFLSPSRLPPWREEGGREKEERREAEILNKRREGLGAWFLSLFLLFLSLPFPYPGGR